MKEKNELSTMLLFNKTIIQFKMFQVLDNETVRGAVEGKTDYNDIPIEDPGNEIVKGYFFKDQADFIRRFGDDNPLCSAIESQCLKDGCRLYADMGHSRPVCREYKIYFKNVSNQDLMTYVEQEFKEALLRAQAKSLKQKTFKLFLQT